MSTKAALRVKAELLTLAERVESGTGRDFHLLSDIAKAIWPVPDEGDFLTSVDATEMLREKLLPGSMISASTNHSASRAILWPLGADGATVEANAPTESRARLAAILRAWAEGETKA